VVVVIIVAIVLRGLPNHRANPSPSRTTNDGALQTAAKDRTQHSAPGPADQRTLTRTNTALTMVVMVIVVTIVAVVIAVAAASTIADSVVVGVIVMMLRKRRHNRSSEEKRSYKDRFSKLGHPKLDARFQTGEDRPRKFPVKPRPSELSIAIQKLT